MNHGELIRKVKKRPLKGFIFKNNFCQFLCVRKNINNVVKIIIRATGPLVKIAIDKNIQGTIQILLSSLETFLQNESRLAPKEAHKRESLTAVLHHIIINGDNAKLNAAIRESCILSLGFFVEQNIVSAIIIIRNSPDKAEGSLAEKEPNSSQASLPGIEYKIAINQ